VTKNNEITANNTIQQKDLKHTIIEYAQAIIIAFLLAMFIRTFFIQAFKIPSGSMISTLLVGDHLLVNKCYYGIRNPFNRDQIWIKGKEIKKEDVIVFIYPQDRGKDFIKRVIGVPGDTVQIINKKVFVNEKPINEPPGAQWVEDRIFPQSIQPRDNFGPIKVPENKLFVMGDNRDQSYDSRFWGFVPIKDVKGNALIIYWSWDNEKFSPRLGRIGKIIK
jgi:signal peptidase I